MKEDILHEYELKECELEEIKDMLWLVYEDYYSIIEDDLYAKANKYDRLERYLINIYTLLSIRNKEMKEIINKVYEERKIQTSK